MGLPKFFAASLRMLMAYHTTYRVNFVLLVVMTLTINLLFPLLTFLIYWNGRQFPGWGLDQILVLQGFAIFIAGLRQVLFGYLPWEFSRLVREGEFDRVLQKPIGTIPYLFSTALSIEGIPEMLLGSALITLACARLGVAITLGNALLCLLFFIAAIIFMGSLIVLQLSLILRYVQLRRMSEIIYTLSSLGSYPTPIFGRLMQIVLISVIPFSLIAFFPASALLGSVSVFPYFTLAAALSFTIIAYCSWKASLRRYTSAGG